MAKFCQYCGSEIAEGTLYCEKCGSPVQNTPVQSAPVQGTPVVQNNPTVQGVPAPVNQPVYQNTVVSGQKTNGFAITGFVLSIISIFLCCGGILTGIPGLIFSIIGLRDINKTGEDGKGLAIAGIVISGIMLAISLGYILIYVLAIFSV